MGTEVCEIKQFTYSIKRYIDARNNESKRVQRDCESLKIQGISPVDDFLKWVMCKKSEGKTLVLTDIHRLGLSEHTLPSDNYKIEYGYLFLKLEKKNKELVWVKHEVIACDGINKNEDMSNIMTEYETEYEQEINFLYNMRFVDLKKFEDEREKRLQLLFDKIKEHNIKGKCIQFNGITHKFSQTVEPWAYKIKHDQNWKYEGLEIYLGVMFKEFGGYHKKYDIVFSDCGRRIWISDNGNLLNRQYEITLLE